MHRYILYSEVHLLCNNGILQAKVYESDLYNYDVKLINRDSTMDILNINNITSNDYKMAIKRLKPKKSAGPDLIPPYVLKGCAEWLELPLLHLYNLALSSATFPNVWKESVVIPLHKNGCKSDISNYRPISLISAPAKVLEQIIHKKVFQHVKPLISEVQHGFVPQKSTVTNLSVFTNHIYEALENKDQVDAVYTDFKKAFDKVNHEILLGKLAGCGLSYSLLMFFASYLNTRKFIVRFNGNTSGKFSANSGVPQGSNLGPLLFLLFINDLPSVLNTAKSLLYADDQKMFLKIRSNQDCTELQKDINNLYHWSKKNKLPLNIKKCQVLSFSRSKTPILFNYNIADIELHRIESVKDLGVTYDSAVNFKKHVQYVVADSYRNLGFLFRQSHEFKNIYTIKMLYSTIVRPKLEYASTIWHPNTLGETKQIEKIQNKFLRYLYYKKYQIYPDYRFVRSVSLRHEFEIQSLNTRRNIALVQFGFKIWNNMLCDRYLLSLFNLRVPTKNTRVTAMFRIPTVTYTFNTSFLIMLRLLNEVLLLTEMDLSMQYQHFLKQIYNYYSFD